MLNQQQARRLQHRLWGVQKHRPHEARRWWRAVQELPAPFFPLPELGAWAAQTAEDPPSPRPKVPSIYREEDPVHVAAAFVLALYTYPGRRTFLSGYRSTAGYQGLTGAMAYDIYKGWPKKVADAHLSRIIADHPTPEDVMKAVADTVRALWHRGRKVDLVGTAIQTASLIATNDAQRLLRARSVLTQHYLTQQHSPVVLWGPYKPPGQDQKNPATSTPLPAL